MTDYYLKFTDQAQALAVLGNYQGSVDVIGTIHKRTGGTDDAPVMEALDGWHVNVRGPEKPELAVFAVDVGTPVRTWA